MASIEHEFGAVNIIDAVPNSGDIQVTDVELFDDGDGGYHFTGRLVNHSSAFVESPKVWVFGVNSVGRPYVSASELGFDAIVSANGGSWAFETRRFEVTVTDWVTCSQVDDSI